MAYVGPSLKSAASAVSLAVTLVMLNACRIAATSPTWVEAHGRGYFSAIAASARGLAALGAGSGVYGYPGEFGRPWLEVWNRSAVALAASESSTYALTADGEIWLVQPNPSLWRKLPMEKAPRLFGGANDDLFAILDGIPKRIKRDTIEDLPCSMPAQGLAARAADVFVLSQDGSVWLAKGNRCEPVALDAHPQSIAVTADTLFVLEGGVAHYVRGRTAIPLPAPSLFRGQGSREQRFAELSASNDTLWGLSSEGQAFQLVMP